MEPHLTPISHAWDQAPPHYQITPLTAIWEKSFSDPIDFNTTIISVIRGYWIGTLAATITHHQSGDRVTLAWTCGCVWRGYVGAHIHTNRVHTYEYCPLHHTPGDPHKLITPLDLFFCWNCLFPLEEGFDFDAAQPQVEHHPEVFPPNNEYFDGFADGIEYCPICALKIDYDAIYNTWLTNNQL